MLITHTVDRGVLRVTLGHELDISSRAAAVLEVEVLIRAHRPVRVVMRLPTADPAPATLSAVLRARRLCRCLGIPLVLAGATARVRSLVDHADIPEGW